MGYFDVPNTFIFKNHHLHHCFQKLIKSFFLKTHEFMFQTEGISPWLIHFQNNHHHHLFKTKKKFIITKISKNHAFILN